MSVSAFCIDKYEYPNRPDVRCTVMNDFPMAQRLCAEQKKRVCTETEWTMACEGPEYKPYPYGYSRDPTICRGDQSGVEPNIEGKDDRGVLRHLPPDLRESVLGAMGPQRIDAIETWLKAKVGVKGIANLRPAFRQPIFFLLARSQDNGNCRPFKTRVKCTLPFHLFIVPWP